MKKNILMMSIVALIIVVSGCSNGLKAPRIELSATSFDLGDIDPDKGERVETFFVKNTGDAPLSILAISTSCGCTEAEVESEEILPGEQTKLTVMYDPSVHPGLVGEIQRIVYIKSNDPLNKEVELELIGNSLPSSKPQGENEEMKEHDDDLREFEISPSDVNSKVKNNERFKLLDVRELDEYEEAHIKDTLLLSVNELSEEKLDELGLQKDDEIIVYCRSGKRSAKAYDILTEMGYKNVKSMAGGIIHWTEEGFSVEEGLDDV